MPAPSMSQKIFDLRLSVETVSLYLLCCGLVDEDRPLSLNTLSDIWNGSTRALTAGLAELENRNIICRDDAEKERYRIVDPGQWNR